MDATSTSEDEDAGEVARVSGEPQRVDEALEEAGEYMIEQELLKQAGGVKKRRDNWVHFYTICKGYQTYKLTTVINMQASPISLQNGPQNPNIQFGKPTGALIRHEEVG